MKHRSFLYLCVVGLSLTSCGGSKHANTKKMPGTWQPTPIVIDGGNKDWLAPYPFYDDNAQLGYAISNDKDNLYVSVETGDLATQLKILKNGLTLWIDKTGEKNEQTAINFPIPQNNDEHNTAPGKWVQGSDAEKLRIQLEDRIKDGLATANEYSLQGFKACNLQYPIMEKDSCGIIARVGIDADNELVWEATIPFKSFYYKPEIDKRDKGRPISICIQTEGLKKPPGQGNGGGQNRTGGGGMRPSVGFGGMGMGMNMGSGRGGSRYNRGGQTSNMNILEPMYKSSVTWKTFGIAVE